MPTKTRSAARWDRIRDSIGSQVSNTCDSFVVRAPNITLLSIKTHRTASLPAIVTASSTTAQDQGRRRNSLPTAAALVSAASKTHHPLPTIPTLVRSAVTYAQLPSGEATQKATCHGDAGRLLRRRSDAGIRSGAGSRMLAEMRWEEAWLKLAEVKVAASIPTEHKGFARRPSLRVSVRKPTKYLPPIKASMPLRASSREPASSSESSPDSISNAE
eukprot:CAMPEP_0180133808 /NCGR_PEP_ID=MMETSP0986-20121125/9758_1 /TAXON_ID=697907 /ORGANISM="non described non described, Strain CCMP2293" /LENGTH=215 /DNA_ID=CAMNT_0022073991 /DNA_START=105 /DNA_END=752 /DNA_ORIENTATION=+